MTVHLLGVRYQPLCGFWRAPEGEVIRCSPHLPEVTCSKCLKVHSDERA